MTSVGLFLVSDFRQAMKAETQRYQSAAYAFAAASSDALFARDTRKVLEVIRGVRDLPEVTYAAARDPEGAVIAEMGAGASLMRAPSAQLFALPTAVTVTADVRKGGETIGTLVLHAEAKGLWARYRTAFVYSSLLGLVLIAITSALARFQVARVTKPLQSLAEEIVDIGRRSDLTRRLTKQRDDEVGILVEAFNEMFGQIDERDRLLQRHRETLEEQVEQRTLQLRVAKEEADAANAAKSNFLATMSHEIRTPMNGMMVMAEMLAAAPLSPRHQRYAEIITRSGKNLVHIINDILDFAKIESGKIELEEIEFSLDAVIEDVACLFAERAWEKQLSLAIYVAPELPARLVGDPVRLTQVLSNLVNNGLKFTDRGGVAISAEKAMDGRFTITVEDTGIGMTPDQIGRIFTRFSQADSSITRKFGGTGLGLSISKQLTELMGGEIAVESTAGGGSHFKVTLPLHPVDNALPVMRSGTARVAVVDSEDISRRMLTKALEARGVSVTNDKDDGPTAIFVHGRDFDSLAAASLRAPVILLRPFAAVTAATEGKAPALEIPMPLSRQILDRVCEALVQGTVGQLELDYTKSPQQIVPDLSHLRVLAVDDVPVNREVLAEALRTFHIECDLADSGPRALEQVRGKSYDLIFMDCSMPGMDGFQAAREIREIEATEGRQPAHVVALTGHVMGSEGSQWQQAGMDSYLAKPFNIAQLSELFAKMDIAEAETLPAVPIALSDMRSVLSEDQPLISPDTLAMFETIRISTGTDVRAKVFSLFRASALPAFELARHEVAGEGAEGRQLIHALKSNCSSIGAARAAALCQTIEICLQRGERPAAIVLESLRNVLCDTLSLVDEIEASL
eukprot:g3897.t1